MAAHKIKTTITDREIILERIFNAPRELVFKMFTTPEYLIQWWSPKDWTIPFCTLDFRPGGVWHYCLQSTEGEKKWVKAIYREIIEPERIVYTNSFSDAEGNVHADLAEKQTTVTFTEEESKTKLTTSIEYHSRAELESMLAMGMIQGTNESWDRLEKYLDHWNESFD